MGVSIEEDLGKRVASLREAADRTQADLAEEVDVAVDTISRLERGTTVPSVSRLAEIADALGVGLHELFEPDPEAVARKPAMEALIAELSTRTPKEIDLVTDLARRVFEHIGTAGLRRSRRRSR